jgi:SAM-dependent methyltransferase
MRERGFEVEGIEPGAEGARRGREDFGIDITHGTLDGASLPVGRYDAVTMWHVLEHLPEPLSALRAINRALALGGVLVVALPDFGSWQAVRFCERWFGVDAPRHLTHFTRASLGMMLAKAGFSEPAFAPAGARYETAMLVRSLWPGLNYRKLDALEKDLPSKYFYKMGQMALDIGLLPAGAFISASGRGVAFTAHASKISPAVF